MLQNEVYLKLKFQFEAEENYPPVPEVSSKASTKSVRDCDRYQTAREKKLKSVPSDTRDIAGRKSNTHKSDKANEESVTGKEESEFSRVFAKLRGNRHLE